MPTQLIPTGVTVELGSNNTDLATTAYVDRGLALKADNTDLTTHNTDNTAHANKFANYLPLSGGAMTGDIACNNPNKRLRIMSGSTANDGGHITLFAKDYEQAGSISNGVVQINVTDGVLNKAFIMRPNGDFSWDGKHIKSMAFPSSTYVIIDCTSVIDGQTSEQAVTYTAPADGYVKLFARGYSTGKSHCGISTSGSLLDRLVSAMTHLGNTEYSAIFLPVTKGSIITLIFYNVIRTGGNSGAYFIYSEGDV